MRITKEQHTQGAWKNGGKTRVTIWRENWNKGILLPANLKNYLPQFIEKLLKLIDSFKKLTLNRNELLKHPVGHNHISQLDITKKQFLICHTGTQLIDKEKKTQLTEWSLSWRRFQGYICKLCHLEKNWKITWRVRTCRKNKVRSPLPGGSIFHTESPSEPCPVSFYFSKHLLRGFLQVF